MTAELLQTKLFIPPLRPDNISRPRLLHKLDLGLRHYRALTLISAPAGYGKSTLLVEWIRKRQLPVAWVSIDEGDNEPIRFFSYVVSALQEINQSIAVELQKQLQATQPPTTIAMMTTLINSITAETSSAPPDQNYSVILVLDDFHAVTQPPVHESIDYLLENMPPGMHLVIVTRQDPPLALSRLRGRGLITEIRQDDLRFSTDESFQYLVDSMGLDASTDDVETLKSQTEGWIAGLQLAALSLQGLEKEEREQFIATFSGRHHFVLDYLTDEVLKRQPAHVQDFLLFTSVLDQFNGSLCDAVLEGTQSESELAPDLGSQSVLETLESSNLFLVPLDSERLWYRYHHLFAQLLWARLQESRPEIVPELHQRAAAWYERNGSMAEAVHHQLEAGDMDMAADVIGRAIKEFATWSKVEIKTFLEWLQALPDEVLGSRPWLRLFASRSLFVTGKSRRAALTLEQLDIWLESNPDFPEAARLKGLVRADRASYAVVQGAVQEGITYAQSALDNLGGEDGIGRMRASAILGLATFRGGEVDASKKAFTEAIDLAIGLDLSFGAVPLICNLAEVQITQGKLSEALKSSNRALELGIVEGRPTAPTGFARLQRGKILYERNDLPAAEINMRKALELLSRGGITESFGNVHALFALVQQALGYPEKATLMAQEAVESALQGRIERIIILAQAYQARIWLAQGSIGRAVHWADEYTQLDPTEYLKEFEDLTLARVLLASDQPAEAMALLDSLSGPAETMGRFNTVIQVRLLQGLVAEALGQTGDALDSVRQALISAEPEGYRRVFLDLGLPMAKLLSQLTGEGRIQSYVSELLANFEDEANLLPKNQQQVTIKPISKPSFLVEPLSGRELEVLHLLAKGHTNREIAQMLVLSTNTVRSHTYNIYGKLDVHSRTQAVARARELNILESD